MRNIFIIYVVLAAVVQGGFASSSAVEGIEASSDIDVARIKTIEELTQAIELIFGSIEGNTSSDDVKDGYHGHLLKGCDYYFAEIPSFSHDNALRHRFESSSESFVVTLCKAIDLAQSKDGTYPETVTGINAIRASLDVEPVVNLFFELIGSSSIVFRTKLIADLDIIYSNIFGAMISRAALNFGLIDEIPSSFKDGAITGVQAISGSLYDSLKDNVISMLVFSP